MPSVIIQSNPNPINKKEVKKKYKELFEKYSFYKVKFKSGRISIFYDSKENKHEIGDLVYTTYETKIVAETADVFISNEKDKEQSGIIVKIVKRIGPLMKIHIGLCSSTPIHYDTPEEEKYYLIAECKFTELKKSNVYCLVDDIDNPMVGDILYVTIPTNETQMNSQGVIAKDYDAEVEIVNIQTYSMLNLPCRKSSLKRARKSLGRVIVKDKAIGLKIRTEDGFVVKARCNLQNPEIGQTCIIDGANDYIGTIEEFIQIGNDEPYIHNVKEIYRTKPQEQRFRLKISKTNCIEYIYLQPEEFFKNKIGLYSIIYFKDFDIQVGVVIGIDIVDGLSKSFPIINVQNHDSVIKLFATSEFKEIECERDNGSRFKRLIMTKCNYPENTLYLNDYFYGIDEEAFEGNTKLKNLVFNTGYINLSDRAFASSDLENIVFSKPFDINLNAFIDCDSLDVILPIEMYYLKDEIDQNFTTTNINIDFDMNGVVDHGDYFIKDRYILAAIKNKDIEEFEVPLGITTIADNCFRNCEKLRVLKTNCFVDKMGYNSLLGCIAIESIESLLELEELQKAFGYDNRYAIARFEDGKKFAFPDSLTEISKLKPYYGELDKTESPEVLVAYAKFNWFNFDKNRAIDYCIIAAEQGYEPAFDFLAKMEREYLNVTPKERNQMNRLLHGFRDAFDTLVDMGIADKKDSAAYKKCDIDFGIKVLKGIIEHGGIDRVNLEKIYKHYVKVLNKELNILFYKAFKLLPTSQQSKYFADCASAVAEYPEFNAVQIYKEIVLFSIYYDSWDKLNYEWITPRFLSKLDGFSPNMQRLIRALYPDREDSETPRERVEDFKEEMVKWLDNSDGDEQEFYKFNLYCFEFEKVRFKYSTSLGVPKIEVFNKYMEQYQKGDILSGVMVCLFICRVYPKFGMNEEHYAVQAQIDMTKTMDMLNDLISKGYHNKYKVVYIANKTLSYEENKYIINGMNLLTVLNGPQIPVVLKDDYDISEGITFENILENWQTYKFIRNPISYVGVEEKLFNKYRPVLVDGKLYAFTSAGDLANYAKANNLEIKYDRLISPSMLEMYYLGKMLSVDAINCIVRGKNDLVSLNKIYETLNLKYPDFKYIDEEYQDIDVAFDNALKEIERMTGKQFAIDFNYRKYNMLTV